jgi:hypothetical protein
MKIGRNDPCPCGSGRKYKKCHLDEDEASARAASAKDSHGTRQVQRVGGTYLVSGGVTDDQLDLADEYVAERAAGRGPAQQMVEFVQPLLDQTDGSTEAVNKVMSLGMICWNLAMAPNDDQARRLSELAEKTFPNEETRAAFRETARVMVERHHQMFPELHDRSRE